MKLILQGQPIYTPNETDFQIPSFQTKLTTITNGNNAANTSYANSKVSH